MSAANRSDRGATYGGFLTRVIDVLRRSATLADQHQSQARRNERPRGAAPAPPARAARIARRQTRSVDAPVVVTGMPNRKVSARPRARAAHAEAPLAELLVIFDSVGDRHEH